MLEKLREEDGLSILSEKLSRKNEIGQELPILLYGTGNIADMIQLHLAQLGKKPAAFIVSDKHFENPLNKRANGLVIKYSERQKYFNDFVLIIATDHLGEALIEKIIEENTEVIQLAVPMFSGLDRDYIKTVEERMDRFYESLEDDKSRMTLCAFLNACLTFEQKYIREVFHQPAYFIDEVKLNRTEVFVDGGAYTGDTFGSFLKASGQSFKSYYAFEPAEENYSVLLEEIKGYSNVFPRKQGLSNMRKVVKFDESRGISSKITDIGKSEVEVDTIDHICPEATFIKMDIEGEELEALKGAQMVLIKNRPKLAISIYHKKEHLLEIAEYIQSLSLDYKMYLRQHNSASATDLVLYAVPRSMD